MSQITTAFVVALMTVGVALAAEPPRADPPEFSAEDRDAFFDDAFSKLVGPRPDYAAERKAIGGEESATAGDAGWAELVDSQTLETEVKRVAQRLSEATRSAEAFKAGGVREAADALGLVATLLAVIAEHEDRPRWADSAAALRDRFASAASAAEASDAGYEAATAAAADLLDLVRGARPSLAAASGAGVTNWGELASREGLMRRMEQASDVRLKELIADRRLWRRGADEALHEAQVLALLAEASARPGAPDAEGDDYRAFAERLRDAARAVAEAALAEDHAAAVAAFPAIERACADCHADYRG